MQYFFQKYIFFKLTDPKLLNNRQCLCIVYKCIWTKNDRQCLPLTFNGFQKKKKNIKYKIQYHGQLINIYPLAGVKKFILYTLYHWVLPDLLASFFIILTGTIKRVRVCMHARSNHHYYHHHHHQVLYMNTVIMDTQVSLKKDNARW